jgi:hypothetical protein
MAGGERGTGSGRPGPIRGERIDHANPRPAMGLDEVLELLVRESLLPEQIAKEIEARATTLKSRVLKEQVGSVRSQAAAR